MILHVGNGRSEHVCLDIMFLAVRASCSLAVWAMRACAQGGSRGPCPPGEGSGGVFAPPREAGGLGGRRPRNSIPRQTQNQILRTQVFFDAGCSLKTKRLLRHMHRKLRCASNEKLFVPLRRFGNSSAAARNALTEHRAETLCLAVLAHSSEALPVSRASS